MQETTQFNININEKDQRDEDSEFVDMNKKKPSKQRSLSNKFMQNKSGE